MILETNRLILKPYQKSDADAVYQVVSNKEIAETTMSIPHPYPLEHVDVWIDYLIKSFELKNTYEFAIFLKDIDRYIGNCGLVNISKDNNNGEIGYFIDPNDWGKGFASEACSKIVEFGFSKLHLERIYGRCMSKNQASRRVMEKSGFTFEGCGKHEVLKWGQYEDVDHFGMISADWQKQ